MDNNMGENVAVAENLQSETVAAETEAKQPGKKKFIIIGVVAIAILVVALVLLFGGVGKGKIKIEGKKYSYSAEEGIKGIVKGVDGVAVMNNGYAVLYTEDGKSEPIDPLDTYGGEYPVVYFGSFDRFTEVDMSISEFAIYGEFETQSGATHESVMSDLDNDDFCFAGGVWYSIVTEDGAIDWDDIEKDYEKLISEGTFDAIDYVDSLLLVSPDAVEPSVYMDDVQGAVDMFEMMSSDKYEYASVKSSMMIWLARGKAVDMLLEGETDYVAVEGVLCSEDEGGMLNIQMYTSKSDAQKIRENFGLTQ